MPGTLVVCVSSQLILPSAPPYRSPAHFAEEETEARRPRCPQQPGRGSTGGWEGPGGAQGVKREAALWLRRGARRAEARCWRRRGELGLETRSPGRPARRQRATGRAVASGVTAGRPRAGPVRGLAVARGTRSAPRLAGSRRPGSGLLCLCPPPRLAGWRRHRLLVPGHRRRRRRCSPGRTLSHFPAGGAEDAACSSRGEIASGPGWGSPGARKEMGCAPLDGTAAAGGWDGAHQAGAPSRTREAQRGTPGEFASGCESSGKRSGPGPAGRLRKGAGLWAAAQRLPSPGGAARPVRRFPADRGSAPGAPRRDNPELRQPSPGVMTNFALA